MIVLVHIKRLDSSAKESIYGESFGNLETGTATWAALDNPQTSKQTNKQTNMETGAATWAALDNPQTNKQLNNVETGAAAWAALENTQTNKKTNWKLEIGAGFMGQTG